METRQEFKRARTLGAVYSESVGEYALPDYNTDIKKILLTDARAVPSGVFSGGDTLDCAGVVNYKMVYLDGENEITHLEFSTDYDFSVRCDMEKYIDSCVNTRVSNFSIRLLGPRKIMAKATLESDVRLIENEELVIMGDATGENPELATARTLVRCASQHTLGEREYAEPLCNIEGALEDEIEVLFVDAAAKELTVTPDGEGRTLPGGLLVRALIKNADKEPTMYEREIEISEPIDFEYASSDLGTRVGATVTSLVTTVNAEEDGVSVVASLICEYTLYTEGNTDITVVTDGYCTDFAVDNEYGDFYYTELMDTVKLEDEIKGEIMRESCGCEKARAISCATGTLRNVSAHVDGDKLKIEGEIRFSGVACEENGEGEPTFAAFRLDVPFEKHVNLNCHYSENVRAECTVEVVRADVELDTTAVYPSATLATYISLVEDKRVRRLAVSNLSGERLIPEANRVHVIFPEASDTLFEIAKRYHTTVAHVAAVNALTEECVSTSAHPSSLSGIKRLIIK